MDYLPDDCLASIAAQCDIFTVRSLSRTCSTVYRAIRSISLEHYGATRVGKRILTDEQKFILDYILESTSERLYVQLPMSSGKTTILLLVASALKQRGLNVYVNVPRPTRDNAEREAMLLGVDVDLQSRYRSSADVHIIDEGSVTDFKVSGRHIYFNAASAPQKHTTYTQSVNGYNIGTYDRGCVWDVISKVTVSDMLLPRIRCTIVTPDHEMDNLPKLSDKLAPIARDIEIIRRVCASTKGKVIVIGTPAYSKGIGSTLKAISKVVYGTYCHKLPLPDDRIVVASMASFDVGVNLSSYRKVIILGSGWHETMRQTFGRFQRTTSTHDEIHITCITWNPEEVALGMIPREHVDEYMHLKKTIALEFANDFHMDWTIAEMLCLGTKHINNPKYAQWLTSKVPQRTKCNPMPDVYDMVVDSRVATFQTVMYAGPSELPPAGGEIEVSYDKMPYRELQALCKTRGLPSGGKREVLLERLG